MIKQLVKQLLPPVISNGIRKLRFILNNGTEFYGVKGDFDSWEVALKYCEEHMCKGGYEAANILEKVSCAIQEVRNGSAEFEMDSVLFYKKEYNYQFLTALFFSMSSFNKQRPIHVVDFGGSLGSLYFQHRSLFESMTVPLVWNVIEQKHFVKKGEAEVPEINFYENVDDFIHNGGSCDILLLSSVLEYIETPFELLNSLLKYKWDFVIIDRSQYHPDNNNAIGVQSVPPSIYKAMYPIWLRSEVEQHKILSLNGYNKIEEWLWPATMKYKKKNKIINNKYKGFLYMKKD